MTTSNRNKKRSLEKNEELGQNKRRRLNESGFVEFESIEGFEETHCLSKLGDFSVIMRKADGFINASKMISTYKPGSKFKEWRRNAKSKEFVTEVANKEMVNESELFELEYQNAIRGM